MARGPDEGREAAIAADERHNAAVRAAVPPDSEPRQFGSIPRNSIDLIRIDVHDLLAHWATQPVS
jgi:hypothetical protein